MLTAAAHPRKSLRVFMLTYVMSMHPLFRKRNFALPGNSMPSSPKGHAQTWPAWWTLSEVVPLPCRKASTKGHYPDPLGGKSPPKMLPSALHRGLVPFRVATPQNRCWVGKDRWSDVVLLPTVIPSQKDSRSI